MRNTRKRKADPVPSSGYGRWLADAGRATQERHAGKDSLGNGSGEGKCMICLFQSQKKKSQKAEYGA